MLKRGNIGDGEIVVLQIRLPTVTLRYQLALL
jgi:hypothetical protein